MQQEEIENGSLSIHAFIDNLYKDIENLMHTSSDINFAAIKNKEIDPISCPICSNNSLEIKPKLAVCSECDFKIWRVVAKKELTNNMIIDIAQKKGKLLKGFVSKAGKKFDAKLIVDVDTKSVKFSFN